MSPVFDIHTHVFPDAIAARVVADLGQRAGLVPSYDGTLAAMLKSMAKAGITGALNCPVATRPEQVESVNRWAIAHHAWPVLSLGSIHPRYPALEAELERISQAGLPGIKLHPEYQDFYPDAPEMHRIWATCSKLKLLVLLHAGEDIDFPPPCHTPPSALRRLIEQYPELRLVLAHFGGWRLWQEVEEVLIGQPVYLDVSFTAGYLDRDKLVELIRRHGSRRVLFGTDAPWTDQSQELVAFRQLPLTADEQSRILWENAAGLLKLPAG